MFAPGSEIQDYLRECSREEGLLPHIRFDTEMLETRWDDQAKQWNIVTNNGVYTARVLIIAAGRLSEASIPAVDGLDTFPGRTFHSSRWDHDVGLDGKRIGIVGTGASAIQVVPYLAEKASRLVVFQRSAPYIVPRQDRAYTEAEKRLFVRDPTSIENLRSQLFWSAEEAFAQRASVTASIAALRALAIRNLTANVSDPTLRERLTPDYEIGCKRVLFSNDYYRSIVAGHVALESSALAGIDGSRAIAVSGRAYDLDVLVFATGFQSTRPPFARRVIGRNGTRLSDHWSNGMTAFASTVVHGYPNLFIIDGPNASLGHNSAIYPIETQIDYILGALAFQAAHGDLVLEVSKAAEDDYTREIDRMSRSTVWIGGGCRSWYLDQHSGRLTLLWPDFAHSFRETNGTFDPSFYALSSFSPRAVEALSGRRA